MSTHGKTNVIVEKRYDPTLTMRIPEEDLATLKQLADKQGVATATMGRMLILEALRGQGTLRATALRFIETIKADKDLRDTLRAILHSPPHAAKALKGRAILHSPPRDAKALEGLVSVPVAARMMAIHPRTLQKALENGSFPGIRIRTRWRVAISVIDQHLAPPERLPHERL